MTEKELCQKAMDMLQRSYVPYSHFPVGAALECEDGTVYTGCNIENASYTPTVCAERSAFFKAVYDGHREFVAIAVCGGKDGVITGAFPPCGVCRQVIREFAPELEIICLNEAGDAKHFTLPDLLPHGFGGEFL